MNFLSSMLSAPSVGFDGGCGALSAWGGRGSSNGEALEADVMTARRWGGAWARAAVLAGMLSSAAGVSGQCPEPAWLPGHGNFGLSNTVNAVTMWDPDGAGPQPVQLIAGGRFNDVGLGIARWDGQQWRGLGTGTSGHVNALTTWDPDGPGPLAREVVAGGVFTTAGGETVNLIAHWDGSSWRGFGTGMTGVLNPAVYALTTWDPDGDGPLPEQLIAGGLFSSAGGVAASNIARWDGAQWQALGAGTNLDVRALTTWDPDGPGPRAALLIAGGHFNVAGEAAAFSIGSWDGFQWQGLGVGMAGTDPDYGVTSLTSWDPDGAGPLGAELVAVGNFTLTGNLIVNRVARWNGVRWQRFGGGAGFSAAPRSVAAIDPDGSGPAPERLVVGGTFSLAGGAPFPNIAYWTGSAWAPLGNGLNGAVLALTVWPSGSAEEPSPQLAAGGIFTGPSSSVPPTVASVRIGRFTFGGFAPTVGQTAAATSACAGGDVTLSVAVTGSGPLTYQWRHESAPGSGVWLTLADGANVGVGFVAGASMPTMRIGGLETGAGGRYEFTATNSCGAASSILTLRVCLQDFDCSGTVDPDDLADFITCYFDSPPCGRADFNADGHVDADDLSDFVSAYFGAGC